MKTLISIITFLTTTISLTAQRQISPSFTKIKNAQFESCINTVYLKINTQIIKQAGKLTIPIPGKNPKVFKDDNSDENFHEFEYIGDIKETKLSLVKRTSYNSEVFYIVNCSTGSVDTLIGRPVFAQNMRDFACLNNPGTDEKQQLQICELKKGSVKTRVFLHGRFDTFFEDIICINRNSISTKDKEGNYWILNYNISEE
jgi:hypothetical protein